MTPPTIILAVTNDLTYDRRMGRICTTLAEEGYNVILVGRRLKESIPFTSPFFTGHRLYCYFRKGFLFYAEYNIRLFWYLLFASFDAVCACDLDTALPVSLVARWRKKKSIYDAHEYYTEAPELTGRPFVKGVWEWVGRYTVPKFNLRYTVGESIRKILEQKYRVPFLLVRNIAPKPVVAKEVTPIMQRENILLYQGALNMGRGLDTMIEAMPHLSGWRLWLAGEGDLTDQLKEKVRNLGLEKQITFLGWVKPADLPDLLLQGKLGINLRERGSLNDYYSLANKLFDGIHAGLPSIQMDYPEYAAICAQWKVAILLPEFSKEKIIQAVRSVETDPDLLREMAVACAKASEMLNWEKESMTLRNAYRSLFSA